MWDGSKFLAGTFNTSGGTKVILSTDGITWTGSSLTDPNLYDVEQIAFNGSRHVAVGLTIGSSGSTIYYSDNGGYDWTPAPSSSGFTQLYSVVWNGSMFVVAGFSTTVNKLGYSYDGIDWIAYSDQTLLSSYSSILSKPSYILPLPSPTPTQTNTATPTQTTSVTPSTSSVITQARTVAVGSTNNKIGFTLSGLDWSAATSGGNLINGTFGYGVATNGSRFVAGGNGTNTLIYSDDGLNWSVTSNGSSIFGTEVRAVGYSNNRWVAVGINAGSGRIGYSNDGITWSAATNSTVLGSTPLAVSSNGSRWVVGAQAGGVITQTLFYSDDNGVTWAQSSNGSTRISTSVRGIVWGGDRFVALGQGTNIFSVSYDGITWSAATNGNALMTLGYGIAHNGSRYVAAGQGTNEVLYSNDGFTWSATTNGNSIIDLTGYAVSWDGNKFIIGGMSSSGAGVAASSSDGINWTAYNNTSTIFNSRINSLASKTS